MAKTTKYGGSGVVNFHDMAIGTFMIPHWFEKLLTINSPSGREQVVQDFLMNLLNKELRQLKLKVTKDTKGNIYVVKGVLSEGETYPCVAAHMDTVFDNKYEVVIAKRETKEETSSRYIYGHKKGEPYVRAGLGADDKNGIYIAIELLMDKNIEKMKAVFFVEEETGCVGARASDMNFYKDCSFIIQGDRRNGGDLITTISGSNTVSDEFKKDYATIATKYDYTPSTGSFTDALRLIESFEIGISGFNFSCGYYNAHTANEYTNWDELLHSTEFAREIVTKLGLKKYAYKFERAAYSYSTGYSSHDYKSYGGYSTHKPKARGIHGTELPKSFKTFGIFTDDADDSYEDDELNLVVDAITTNSSCICRSIATINQDCLVHNPILELNTTMKCSCGATMSRRLLTMHCFKCKNSEIIS